MNDALLVVVGGAVATVLTKTADWFFSRSEMRSKSKISAVEADGITTRTLMGTLDVAWDRANDLEYKVEYLNTVVDALLAQLRANNITPQYPPMPPRPGANEREG